MASVRCSTASSSSTNSHSAWQVRRGENMRLVLFHACGRETVPYIAARHPQRRRVGYDDGRFPGNSSRNHIAGLGQDAGPDTQRFGFRGVGQRCFLLGSYRCFLCLFVSSPVGRCPAVVAGQGFLQECCGRCGCPRRFFRSDRCVGNFFSFRKAKITKRNEICERAGQKERWRSNPSFFVCSAEKFPIFAPNWFSPSLPGRGMKREPGVNPGLSRSCDAP